MTYPTKPVMGAVALITCLAMSAVSQETSQVMTEFRSGHWTKNEAEAMVYLGIPYAAPPTGALRWRAPEPPASWTEPLRVGSFGPQCPQNADLASLARQAAPKIA